MPDETVDTSAQATTDTGVTTEENIAKTTEQTTNSAEGKQAEDAKPTGAPEQYTDFTAPEGMTFDKDTATDFMATAKELGLSQDGAQKLVDMYGTKMLAQQEAQRQQVEEWAAESTKMFKPADIDIANKTLSKFGSTELIDMLGKTGLGNHKEMIALFKNIGNQMAEGQFVDGDTKHAPKSAAQILYPNMKK